MSKCHPPFNALQQLNRCTRICRDGEKGQFSGRVSSGVLQLGSCMWHFKICLVDAFARTSMAFIILSLDQLKEHCGDVSAMYLFVYRELGDIWSPGVR